MAALARIFTIAHKEIVDTQRGRRTLLVSLLTAAAAGPMLSDRCSI
jgi:hypothetical protein